MIANLLNNAVITALGWTLVHSLWIALVFAGITRLFFTKVDAERALLRYRISLGSMLGLLAVTIGIFVHYYTSFEAPEVALGPEISMQTTESVYLDWEQVAPTESTSPWSWSQLALQLERYFPILVLLWLLGATFMGVRLAGSWWYLHRMGTQGLQTPDEEWTQLFNHLCTKMGVRRPVRLYWSERVQEPVTLRHIKPIVLFPLGLLTQLSPEQVEIVLLHELAHIKRWDYLVNWLQSLLELLFFYHPAVWWLSAQVRTAREHCCDDLVLQADQQQRMLYAQTLTQLSVYSLNFKSKLAMSYSGNNNQSFTFRVKRLFGQADQSRAGQKPILSGLLVLAFMALIMLNSSNVFAEKPDAETTEEALMALLDPEIRYLVLDEEGLILDTIPVPKDLKADQQEAIYLDGKFLGYGTAALNKVDQSKVVQFRDYKPDFAMETFGEQARNGAINFLTKVSIEKEVFTTDGMTTYDYEDREQLPIYDIIPKGDSLPAYFLNGKRVNDAGLDAMFNLPPDQISKVHVMENPMVYGKRYPEGAVMIYTKDYAEKAAAEMGKEALTNDGQPLVILDGVRQGFGKEKLEGLEPSEIASINVLKGESATEKYGAEAIEGVIEVYTKGYGGSQQAREDDKAATSAVQGYQRTTEAQEKDAASTVKVRGVRKAEEEKPLFIIDGVIVGRNTTKEGLQKLDPADIESINVLKGSSATKKYGEAGSEGIVEINTKTKQRTRTSMKMGKDLKKSVFKYGPKGSLRKMNPLVVLNEKVVGRASTVGGKFKEGEMDMVRFSGPSPELLFRFGKEADEGVVFVTSDVEAKAVEAKGLDESMVYINGEKRGFWKEVKGTIDKTQIASINVYGKEVVPAEYAESPYDIVLVTLKDQMQKGDGRAVELSFQGKASIGSPGEEPMEMDAQDFTLTLKNLKPSSTSGENKITRFTAEKGISIKAFLYDNARHPLLILDDQIVAAHDPAIQNLEPTAVKEVFLIRSGPALLPYGEAAKYGVLKINTQAANTASPATTLERRVEVFPNPFGSSTRINFELEAPARVKVSVFNAQGQLIKVLNDGQLPAGPQQLDWNAAAAPVGTYTVIVQSGEWRSSQTIVKQ